MSTKIIGICGAARAGKTTAAEAIAREFGAKHLSFAEPIRNFIQELTGGYTDDQKEEVIPWIGKSPRQMMQTLGTEWGREMVSSSLWVDRCMRQAEQHPLVVISDVRFQNEVSAIFVRKGLLIHINRPVKVAQVNYHISENLGTDRFAHHKITNNGTVEEFETAVLKATHQWLVQEGYYQLSTP